MPRNFTDVQRALQDCVSRLAEAKDAKDRRPLLAEMRILLKEADSILRREAA
jgi:hypothetical protein